MRCWSAARGRLGGPRLMAVRDRLHRSELAVPGSNTRAMEKAPGLGADVVFLDLEDAVAPDDKEQARENVIAALTGQDWSACSVSVRINGLDTHWCYRDIVEVVERAGAPGHDPGPEGRAAGRRPVRGHDARPDRGGVRPGADQPAHPDRDGAGHGQRRGDRADLPAAPGGDGVRRRRLRGLDAGAHHQHRRIQSRLRDADPRRRGGRARAALGRPVALRTVTHGRRLPRLRAAADRRAVRRLPGRGGLHRRRAQRGPARLRGQVGDPPLPDRARERGVHARHRRRSTGRAGSSRRCSRRRPRARARSRWTAS